MTAEAVAAVFGRSAHTYDTIIPFFSSFGRRLVEQARIRPGDQVLDVASGRGVTLFPAVDRVRPGGRVRGIDLAPEMVELLSADLAHLGVTDATVEKMDAQQLEYPDQTFDVVVCSFALHLVPDPVRAAREFRRVLARGGRCVVAHPVALGAMWSFTNELMIRFLPCLTSRPPSPFLRKSFDLAATLKAGGFSRVATTDVEIGFFLEDEQAWWNWSWSNGYRCFLELLPVGALEELRGAAFERVAQLRTPAGIPLRQAARFATAEG